MYERWFLIRGSKYSDLTPKKLAFGLNWSPKRGGCLRWVVRLYNFSQVVKGISLFNPKKLTDSDYLKI